MSKIPWLLLVHLGMLIGGIVIVASARIRLNSDQTVKGGRARILGVILMIPFLLSFGISVFVQEVRPDRPSPIQVAAGITAISSPVICLIAFQALGSSWSRRTKKAER